MTDNIIYKDNASLLDRMLYGPLATAFKNWGLGISTYR